MYLEIDEGFPKHRKTLRLRSLMRDPKAGWYMIDLWTWACRSCPDGDLTGISTYEIEEAANYVKCDGRLCQAMIDARFIDIDADGAPSALHNWMKRTGASIEKMADEAKRKKLYRLHKDGKCDGQSCEWCRRVRGQSMDEQRTVDRTSDTDQNRPDQTRPEQTRTDQTRTEQNREKIRKKKGVGHHPQDPVAFGHAHPSIWRHALRRRFSASKARSRRLGDFPTGTPRSCYATSERPSRR